MSDDPYIGPTTPASAPGEPSRFASNVAKLVVLPMTIALIAILLVFYVFYSSSYVSGSSMYPTLHDGDRLLTTHGDPDPKRGDIITVGVIESQGPIELVKRVVALPGDTIEVRDDIAYVNGEREPNRGQIVLPKFSVTLSPYKVPAGHVFVMGDNRPVSEDSRYFGAVAESGIGGKAVFVFWPPNRIRELH